MSTEKFIGVYIVKRDAAGKEHAERVRGHTLWSEAQITLAQYERTIDKSRGYWVEIRTEEWEGQTLVSVNGKPVTSDPPKPEPAPAKLDSFFRSMAAEVQEHQLEELARSWCLQDRLERGARRQAIMALSVELEKIRKVSIFATGLAEQVIDDIILGDWEAVERWGNDFTFDHESKEFQAQLQPIWSDFVLITKAACASVKARASGAKAS